jgi:hypothetical protein
MQTPSARRRDALASATPPSATTLALKKLLETRESRERAQRAATAGQLRDGEYGDSLLGKENMPGGVEDEGCSDSDLNDFQDSPVSDVGALKAKAAQQLRRLRPAAAGVHATPELDNITNSLSMLAMRGERHAHGHANVHEQLAAASHVPLPDTDDEEDDDDEEEEGEDEEDGISISSGGSSEAEGAAPADRSLLDRMRASLSLRHPQEGSGPPCDDQAGQAGTSSGGGGSSAGAQQQQQQQQQGALVLGDRGQFVLDARVAGGLYPHQVRACAVIS